MEVNKSIAKQLIAYLILFGSVLALVASAIQLYFEYQRDITRLSTRITEIQTIHQEGLSRTVWATDLEEVSLILSKIIDLPDIVHAEIMREGQILAYNEYLDSAVSRQSIETIKNDTTNFIRSEMPLVYRQSNQNLVIGKLYLYATLENVNRQLYSRMWLVMLTNAVKTAIAALFFYLLFSRLVLRHLGKVSKYLNEFRSGMSLDPLVLDRTPSSNIDELDTLVRDINSMRENLDSESNDQDENKGMVRLLLDSTGEAIYGIDLDGKCTFANPACARMLGFDSVEEFMEIDIHDTIHHTRKDGSHYPLEECRIYSALLKGEHAHVDDEIFWRIDGASFPVEYRSYPIKKNEEVVGSVVTFNNISERKQAEQLLIETSRLNEQIIKEAPIGIAICDSNGLSIATNNAYAEMIGATQEQVLTQNYNNIESWKESGMLDAANRSIEQQQKVRGEFEIFTTFGKHLVLDGIFMPFVSLGEQHLLFMIDDITERRRTETELDKHRCQLEQLVDEGTSELKQGQEEMMLVLGTLNGYVYRDVADEESNLGLDREVPVYMTSGVERLSGYTAEYFIGKEGKTYTDIMHPEDSDSIWAQVKEALAAHREFNVHYRITTRSGELRWVHERGHGVYDENGKALYIEGYILDDHERKTAEFELENYRDHLEQLVEERTRELNEAQSELVRQGRLATLGQLTATVSHELRNPLAALRTSLYTIKKHFSEKADERLMQASRRADRSIDRCDRIIDEMLDYTRIAELNKVVTRLDVWLDSVIAEQEIPQGIEVKKQYLSGRLAVAIDPHRLSRVIINLVENACQAMLDGNRTSGQLIVKTEEANRGITISIVDKGTGIAEDVLPKIFEPLFSTKGFGVGLGMSVVKQIVEQHGGNIAVESEIGEGTTITLWLPINGVTAVDETGAFQANT